MKPSEAIMHYRKLVQKKAELDAEYKQKLAPISEKMAMIENALLGYMQETELLNLKTEEGTAYITTRESVSVADKSIFMDFVREHDMWDLLEVRPAKSAVIQYKDGRGALPPGVNWSAEQVVRVRKA